MINKREATVSFNPDVPYSLRVKIEMEDFRERYERIEIKDVAVHDIIEYCELIKIEMLKIHEKASKIS